MREKTETVKISEIGLDVLDVLLSDSGVCVLYWDCVQGWSIVGNGCEKLPKDGIETLGLDAFIPLVQDKDAANAAAYFDMIRKSCSTEDDFETPSLNPLHAYMHIKSVGDVYISYHFCCRMKQDENHKTVRMVVEISQTTAEERYRLELAQKITNDKTPAFLLSGASQLMQQYPDKEFALIQFDIAKFKVINEQYGEAVGDEILNYIIHTLAIVCREDQLAVRLTADVFMVLTPYEDEKDILTFIHKLEKALSGYKSIPYTLYFGVNYVKDKQGNLRKYGDGAAFARQSIKGNALKNIAFFRDDMKQKAKKRKFIEDHMQEALDAGEFVMYLQPKFSISTKKLIGAEALVRWDSPKYGLIAPNEFIPSFEQNGFIVNMDTYIWEKACKVLREWMDKGYDLVPISVNMSRRHLTTGNYLEVLDSLIAKYGIEKKYLEIELTETVDDVQTADAINALKNQGYVLLMDDFGSGYSSLNTLKDTMFDVVKMDRFFLKDFIDSERGKKIVEHTIQMTKAIGLDMIAEGVETEEQAEFLSSCGCDKAQGFYYAKPMPVEDFNEKYMQ
ncbi:MAG: EAL domain-containing protein [Wujia sp.]